MPERVTPLLDSIIGIDDAYRPESVDGEKAVPWLEASEPWSKWAPAWKPDKADPHQIKVWALLGWGATENIWVIDVNVHLDDMDRIWSSWLTFANQLPQLLQASEGLSVASVLAAHTETLTLKGVVNGWLTRLDQLAHQAGDGKALDGTAMQAYEDTLASLRAQLTTLPNELQRWADALALTGDAVKGPAYRNVHWAVTDFQNTVLKTVQSFLADGANSPRGILGQVLANTKITLSEANPHVGDTGVNHWREGRPDSYQLTSEFSQLGTDVGMVTDSRFSMVLTYTDAEHGGSFQADAFAKGTWAVLSTQAKRLWTINAEEALKPVVDAAQALGDTFNQLLGQFVNDAPVYPPPRRKDKGGQKDPGPHVDFPDFKAPDFKAPTFEAPDFSGFKPPTFEAPDFSGFNPPTVQTPDLGGVQTPDLGGVQAPDLAGLQPPDLAGLQPPGLQAPGLDVPALGAPGFDVPGLDQLGSPSGGVGLDPLAAFGPNPLLAGLAPGALGAGPGTGRLGGVGAGGALGELEDLGPGGARLGGVETPSLIPLKGGNGLSGGIAIGGPNGLDLSGSGEGLGLAAAEEGAAARAGTGGMPYPPPMGGGGAGAGQGKERERKTWLSEEEDVWGLPDDEETVVLGREQVPLEASEPQHQPFAPAAGRPGPQRPGQQRPGQVQQQGRRR